MTVRQEYLTERLTAYLNRRTAPASLKGKPQAQADELSALVNSLLRNAPRSGYDDWWRSVERRVAQDSKHRGWPTEGELYAAGKAASPPVSKTVTQGCELDTLAIMGRRMNCGEVVGAGYLYGRQAIAMVDRGLVTPEILRQYRSGVYFNALSVYGEEKARQMEAGWIAKHDLDVSRGVDLDRVAIEQVKLKRITAYNWDGV